MNQELSRYLTEAYFNGNAMVPQASEELIADVNAELARGRLSSPFAIGLASTNKSLAQMNKPWDGVRATKGYRLVGHPDVSSVDALIDWANCRGPSHVERPSTGLFGS
jgi:hypothetical protein